MKKKVGLGMGIILGLFILAVALLFISNSKNLFHKNKGKQENRFSSEVAPFVESEEETYTFDCSEMLSLVSVCSDVDIKQEKRTDISVEIVKQVGDKQETGLKQELKKIVCSMTNGILEIGYTGGQRPAVNSVYIKAVTKIPDTIQEIKCDCQTGNLNARGVYRKIMANSNTGDVNLVLKEVKNSDVIQIDGKIGDVKISLPANCEINLDGSQKEEVRLGKGISISEHGLAILINKEISNIKIGS